MNPAYELLTVKEAAELLYKSEEGVRRLLKAGKLTALREGRRLLITPESLQKYAAGLPHPVWVMAAMSQARVILGMQARLEHPVWVSYLTPGLSALKRHFLPLAVPVCRELLAAVKGREYAQVQAQQEELWRVQSDYQMLHAPVNFPRHTVKGSQARPTIVQPPLFAGLKGGQA